MKAFILSILVALFIGLSCNLAGCNFRKVSLIQLRAPAHFESIGFRIVAYEGYQIGEPACPGGKVWYLVERKDQPGVIYNCFLSQWQGELHVYSLKAVNAVSAH